MEINARPKPTTRSDVVRLVLISDTHDLHREFEILDGDILIHAGDFTMFSKSRHVISDFNAWLGELPHRHKIVVPGNHEFFFEADLSRRSVLSNAIVLVDEAIEIEELRIWVHR
jgi:predicted phosphohydrolase